MTMMEDLRARLERNGLWQPGQMGGRRWRIGCVSLEVTQRCNLDCSLCYLSENAEAVRDLPMTEIFRRIDMIHTRFGPGTDIQISGGEPTLRKREELVAIVRYIRSRGMRSSLFTNGIRATRPLLAALAEAGLTDVAFHVDTSQRRAGYRTEADLNTLREEYIARASGLPIAVIFNTTVHDANLHEVPMLAAFFAGKAGAVRLASLQLQADTGRGVLGTRGSAISVDGVIALVREGVRAPLSFDTLLIGHPNCNRYAAALMVGDRAHDILADRAFVAEFMRATAESRIDRITALAGAMSLLRAALNAPRLLPRAIGWLARLLWRAKWDLLQSRGKVRKISFFLHNFMDARDLDPERVDSCVFMAATEHGPMSMCAYNARRAELLSPTVAAGESIVRIKWLKGRARAAATAAATATLAACAVLVPVPPAEPVTGDAALAAYARVLARFVNASGEVDFPALAEDRRDLDLYVRHVADTPHAAFADRGRKLAHLVNGYNALSMYNVIQAGIPASHAGAARISFFINRKLMVGGERISLYDLENKVIRPLGEPRVHFALNCSALACPALPRIPFTAAGLESELERETRAFFARPENFRVDHASRQVFLSEIMGFYEEDFVPAHARSLLEYANRYAPTPAPADYATRFTPYDWTVANVRRSR